MFNLPIGSPSLHLLLKNSVVSDDPSLYDHRCICFHILLILCKQNIVSQDTRLDYCYDLNRNICPAILITTAMTYDIDAKAQDLQTIIIRAYLTRKKPRQVS